MQVSGERPRENLLRSPNRAGKGLENRGSGNNGKNIGSSAAYGTGIAKYMNKVNIGADQEGDHDRWHA
jgi:hypothetical protein